MGALQRLARGLGLLVLGLTPSIEAAPVNDHFTNAIPLSGPVIATSGTLFDGTLEIAEPPHGADQASVWYRWAAPRSGRVRLASDAPVAAYTGAQLSSLLLVSRDAPEDQYLRNIDVFDAATSKVYYIAVTGSPTQTFPFKLRLDFAPLNDDFASAFLLTGISNRVQGSTLGGSWETGEPGQNLVMSGNSVWWNYTAPSGGRLEFTQAGPNPLPVMWIYEGNAVSNLTLLGGNRVPSTTPPLVTCQFARDVVAGQRYRIAATGFETNFAFNLVLRLPPPNDSFASRLTLEPSARVSFSTAVGASREPGEPGAGSNSVWWSWTPTQPGPVILTTYGSACDTILSVHVGTSLGTLVPVVSNDDGYIWNTNSPAVGWTTVDGPTNDVISRLRLNADNGVSFKIRVAVAPNNPPPGEVTLNLTKLAIDDITAAVRTTFPDRSVQFFVNLRLANLRNTASARLRLRLVARPGYSYNQTRNYNCPWDNFTIAEIPLSTFPLPGAGTLPAAGVTQIIVNATCPPPFQALTWGYGYGVIAILEEEQSPNWIAQDARLILVGEWPTISGSAGPGGGVITVSSALRGGTQVGFLDVKIGPPAALRLGGAWRVSPTNYGELGELQPYTNYTGNNFRLAIRSTNFSLQVRPLTGFSLPASQNIRIQPGGTMPLDLIYSVNPPRLSIDHQNGLGLTGTPQTAYQIVSAPGLSATPSWSPYTNIALGTSGLQWLPKAVSPSSNRIYRAFWLSE